MERMLTTIVKDSCNTLRASGEIRRRHHYEYVGKLFNEEGRLQRLKRTTLFTFDGNVIPV